MQNKATEAILTNKNEIIEEYSFQLVIIHVFKDVTPQFLTWLWKPRTF